MLDALKRIESRDPSARNQASAAPAEDCGAVLLADESDSAADVAEVDHESDVAEPSRVDSEVEVSKEAKVNEEGRPAEADERADVSEVDDEAEPAWVDPEVEAIEEAHEAEVGEEAGHTDADERADVAEVDQRAEPPVAHTLPFAPTIEAHQTRLASLPEPPLVEPAYLQLAQRIVGQVARMPESAILFTSPGDGEGKTSTVVGLSEALASQESGGVLAVDGNFHRPGLAGLMGVEADRGLGEVLSGHVDWRETIRKTDRDGLSVLPGSTGFSGDALAVNTANLADLLSELRQEFRFVLFDAASLRHPEVAEITRHFDGTYLVVELNRTTRGEARQAVRIIDNSEGRLLGCVVTNEILAESR